MKLSTPLKFAFGVYVIVSSVGLFGVPLVFTNTVPFVGVAAIAILPTFGPSPPKVSLLSTFIVTATSSVVEVTSFTAVGTSVTGASGVIVTLTVAVELSPLLSVMV